MSEQIDFWENIRNGLTMTGLDPYLVENCDSCFFNGFYEVFASPAFLWLNTRIKSQDEINLLLLEASKFSDIGELPCDDDNIWLAAFNMVLVERFVTLAKSDANPWVTCSLFHALYECYINLESKPWNVAHNARIAAKARHAGSPKQLAKNEIKSLWERYHYGHDKYKSAAAFFRAMIQKYPIIESEKTIDKWVRQWRASVKPDA